MTAMDTTRIPIVRRRVTLDFEAMTSPHWLPTMGRIEAFLNGFSYFLPAGERFFIHSVQHYQHRIQDPVLAEQVRRFIYQEAMHTREHNHCNQRLTHTYIHGPRIERLGETALGWAKKFLPKSTQLAITCAIEHFTAILSDTLLQNQEIWVKASSPAVGQLWLWHAIEETEHKAVCFDVYRAMTGHNRVMAYFNRVFAMGLTTLVLLFGVLLAIFLISRNDARQGALPAKPTPDPKRLGKVRHNHRNPLRMLASLVPWRLYFDYYRPTFHPWNHDNAHLVTQWQARFPNFGSAHENEADNSATH